MEAGRIIMKGKAKKNVTGFNNKEQLSTKERILRSALSLFSEKGYLGATTKDIARRAGIAEVTLFRYFVSKERLFEEVINRYSFLPELKEVIKEVENIPFEEGLLIIASRFIEFLEKRKDIIMIMHSEMNRYPDYIHRIHNNLMDRMIEMLSQYFRDFQSKGSVRRFSPEYGARMFLGMFFSYFYAQEIKMRKRYRGDDREETIKEYVDIFINGISLK